MIWRFCKKIVKYCKEYYWILKNKKYKENFFIPKKIEKKNWKKMKKNWKNIEKFYENVENKLLKNRKIFQKCCQDFLKKEIKKLKWQSLDEFQGGQKLNWIESNWNRIEMKTKCEMRIIWSYDIDR